ncbi:PIG-L family deacetylase [PVC group bacterium]|nr:PIG-L family deacetylase [PVC group bacterium]
MIPQRVFDRLWLAFYKKYRYMKREGIFISPKVLKTPPSGRVLVLSPHLDDEMIACGGSLLKHRQQNDEIMVVFMTSDYHSNARMSALLVTERRQKEAKGVMESMDIHHIRYLKSKDGALKPTDKNIDDLRNIIKEYRPSIVYHPWFMDNHLDHLATSEILFNVSDTSSIDYLCYGYGVWGIVIPNVIIDISDVFDDKRRILSLYASQIEKINYIRTMEGQAMALTQMGMKGEGYAEGFMALERKKYCQLMREVLSN